MSATLLSTANGRASCSLPAWLDDALAEGRQVDRAIPSAEPDAANTDLSESEVLRLWRAGVALVVRS